MKDQNIELPPLVGTLGMLPDHQKTVIEAYGRACARTAIEADRKRRGESDIPSDTLGRLYTGRATSGDQMIVWNALNAACATPPSGDRMPDSMRDFITGMAVSVDVSTCDDDADHRYFGTVTEVMDSDDKHGVILLVQDAEPNFGRE